MTVTLATIKRIAQLYVPGVVITASRSMPHALLGVAWCDLATGTPVIVYSLRQSHRERALTILHELAHHVFDIRGRRGRGGRGRLLSRQVELAEVRADRFATGVLSMLEAQA